MQDSRGSADSHQSSYRADLDGLRAIAVLSVVAFHLSSKLVPGGFLGVDIFFVLSGYLITRIIWRDAINGQFSLKIFYERRVRRIMPALLVVLIAVCAFSAWILLPIDLKGSAKSALATLGFVANVYFWSDTGYFALGAEQKPLLHMWSLGVEEQFYLLFPLLVVLCTRWRRSALLSITIMLVVVSLLSNLVADKMALQSVAFYLLPARAWELGAGALLALRPLPDVKAPWMRQVLAVVGAALIAVGLIHRSGGGLFGGLVPDALWVVLGATLAVYLGEGEGNWLTGCLSFAPVAWIGLISYSLYLWHWPILVFARYYLPQALSPSQQGIALASMFGLAVLSWRFVERPFRDRSMPIRTVLIWTTCGVIMVAAASAAALMSKGYPGRFDGNVAQINEAVGNEYRCTLSAYIPFGPSRGCQMNLPSRKPEDATVVLLGNSHAQMYAPLVASIVGEKNERGLLVPLNICLPLPDLNLGAACLQMAARNLAAVEALPKVRTVILAMTWEWKWPLTNAAGEVPRATEQALLLASLDRLIAELESKGKTVVLVGPIAMPGWDVPSIVGRSMAFHHAIAEPLYATEADFMQRQGGVFEHFAGRKDLIFIRPDQVQCMDGRCDYVRGGRSFFSDPGHITQSALPMFRPLFEEGLRQAFERAASARRPGF